MLISSSLAIQILGQNCEICCQSKFCIDFSTAVIVWNSAKNLGFLQGKFLIKIAETKICSDWIPRTMNFLCMYVIDLINRISISARNAVAHQLSYS